MRKVNRYRIKPKVVEAIQFDGTNWSEIKSFCADGAVSLHQGGEEIDVHTLAGTMTAIVDDWIIKHPTIDGEFYALEEEDFDDKYEIVAEARQ